MTNPAISAAARTLAAAQERHAQAREKLVEVEGRRVTLAERIEALEADRSSIVARRRAGDGRDDDGGRLELIRVDLEALTEMVGEVDKQATAAMKPVQEAMSMVQAAQFQLDRLEHEIAETAAIENATKLDALLLANLRQIAALRGPLGRNRPMWAPSPALWSEFKKLAAAAGVL